VTPDVKRELPRGPELANVKGSAPGTRSQGKRFGEVPKYYFHLHNDMDVPDEEGTDLPDLEAARDYAIRQARVTFAETAKDTGRVVMDHRIDIEDEQGAVVDTVRFRDAVRVEG
jgi:hypothetical protein